MRVLTRFPPCHLVPASAQFNQIVRGTPVSQIKTCTLSRLSVVHGDCTKDSFLYTCINLEKNIRLNFTQRIDVLFFSVIRSSPLFLLLCTGDSTVTGSWFKHNISTQVWVYLYNQDVSTKTMLVRKMTYKMISCFQHI
jgi:hypothetical protein